MLSLHDTRGRRTRLVASMQGHPGPFSSPPHRLRLTMRGTVPGCPWNPSEERGGQYVRYSIKSQCGGVLVPDGAAQELPITVDR